MAEESSRARLTITKVEPQITVLNTSARSAVRGLRMSDFGWFGRRSPVFAKQQFQRQHDALQSQVAAFRQKPLAGRVGFAARAARADRDRRDIEGERNIGVGRGA